MKRLLAFLAFLFLAVLPVLGQDFAEPALQGYLSPSGELLTAAAMMDSPSLIGKYLQVYASDPTCSRPGQMYFNSALGKQKNCTVAGSPGTWETVASGASVGDVIGPASAVDNHLAVFDGTTGKLIKDGGAIPTATPAGSDTQVQFNDSSAFGGDAGLTYNKTTDTLTAAGNLLGSNVAPGFATTATTGGTTALSVASKGVQEFTGSANQTVTLPVVSTLPQTGFQFVIINRSSGTVEVDSSGGSEVQTLAANTTATFTCRLLTGALAGSWDVTYGAPGIADAGGAASVLLKRIGVGTVGDSRITDDATDIKANSGAGDFYAGDTENLFNRTYLNIIDSTKRILLSTNSSSNNTYLFLDGTDKSTIVQSLSGVLLGDADGNQNSTTLSVVDDTKTITAATSTESFTLDGTAHTASIVAASQIKNTTPLWGTGTTGADFRVDADGRIIAYAGSPPTDGKLLIGDTGSGIFNAATLTPGTGISITNGAGSITVAQNTAAFTLDKTITASGTTGAQTINKPTGAVNFAAAATSLVVTNSLVTTSSVLQCTIGTNDATMKSAQCVAGSGSFTIFSNAAATAETRVYFTVSN